jgi:predicted nuclease of predicted toxin-antitoxin system
MKLLLDESLPKDLARHLVGHTVTTVPQHGWASEKNGELLRLASAEFDIFVTADQNLEFQQDLRKFNIGIVVLIAHSNRIEDLLRLVPRLLEILPTVTAGQLVRVGA